jgi:Tfp pilus assembly protein PilO
VTSRDRIVVAVIAVLVGLAGFWFLALKPKREELGRLNTELAQHEQRRDAAQGQIQAGEAARAEYGDHARTLARIGKAVPADDQLATLVYQIQATAKKKDVAFVSVDVTTEDAAPPTAAAAVPAGAPKPVPFSMTFEGGFFEVERFLSALEKYTSTRSTGETVISRGRLVTLNGVTIGAAEDGFPRVTVTLTTSAYSLPKADVAVAGATAPPAGAAPAPTTPSTSSTPAPTTASARGVTP